MKTKKNRAFSFIEISIVLIIIGILIAGVTQSSRLIKMSRLQTAQTITQSSPVSGMKGVSLWLDTTSVASFAEDDTNEGSAITMWNDINPQSIKNNMTPHVNTPTSPATSSSDITYKEAGISGLPVINFAGNSGAYFSGNTIPTLGNKFTAFVVYQSTDTSSTDERVLFSNGTIGTDGFAYKKASTSGAGSLVISNGTPLVLNTISINPEIVSIVFDGATARVWLNGGGKVTASLSEVTPSGSFYIGGTNSGSAWKGYIGEIIIIEGSLKDSDRYDVEKYLGKKWGVTMLVSN